MKYQIFKRIFFSKFNLLLGLFVLTLLLIITVRGTVNITSNIPLYSKVPKNVIELLDVGESQSSYNSNIKQELNGNKQLENQFDGLDNNELLELSQQSFIENVYVVDSKYMNDIRNGNPINNIVSIPDEVSSSLNFKSFYPGFIDSLTKGRLPKNDKNEAVLSYKRLQSEFGFRGNIEEAIGHKVKINGTAYTIVGLTELPQTLISFSNSMKESFGVIRVNKESISKLNEINEYKIANGYPNNKLFSEAVYVVHKTGYDKVAMDYLVNKAPSYQFSSNYINNMTDKMRYKKEIPTLLFTASICVLIGILMILVSKKYFQEVYSDINNENNSNFQSIKITSYLFLTLFIDYLIILPILIIKSKSILESNFKYLIPYLVIGGLTFLIPILILPKLRNK